ncbi:MAG: c-type cytochrome domain-containing protein [Candidatus Neomarinimicrobiota bacterium]
MKKLMVITLMLIIAAVLTPVLMNCDGNEASQPSYASDIDPLFGTGRYNCKFCHTSASTVHLDLTTYDGLMRGSDNGVVVIAGDADNSLLYQKISTDTPPTGERMPQGGTRMTSTEISLIEDWINQGAKDN